MYLEFNILEEFLCRYLHTYGYFIYKLQICLSIIYFFHENVEQCAVLFGQVSGVYCVVRTICGL